MAYKLYFLQIFVLYLTILIQGTLGVQFKVQNTAGDTPGGQRFTKEIGIDYARQTMKTTTKFIWRMFQQNSTNDRKQVDKVLMVIHEYKGAEAFTYGETINVSSVYLEGYQGNVKWEFTSLIHHEMTHVWQWNGAGQAPLGLIEGIADYTILKANYYPPGYAKPGMGDRWDQGYDFTARFLEYCEGIKPGFVAALNRKMKDSFSIGFFEELLGKPCDQLWREYKEKYGHRVEKNVSGYRNESKSREYEDRYELML